MYVLVLVIAGSSLIEKEHLNEERGLRREGLLRIDRRVGGPQPYGVGRPALKVEIAAQADDHHIATGTQFLKLVILTKVMQKR